MAKSPFKRGDQVRQVVAIIQGEVTGFEIDQVTGERKIMVEWQDPNDADGDGKTVQNRWFDESHLELVPPEPAAAPAPAPVATTAAASPVQATSAVAASGLARSSKLI